MPPLAGVAAAIEARIFAGSKGFWIAGSHDRLDGGGRHDLNTVPAAAEADHLAEAGEIAERCAHAATGEGRADSVDLEIGRLFHGHFRPVAGFDLPGDRLAGDAGKDPRQNVGIGGAINEVSAMRRAGSLADGGEKGGQRRRAGVTGGRRYGAIGHRQPGHVGELLAAVTAVAGIDFVEGDRGAHVHDLAHAGVAVTAGGEFRDIAGNGAGRVELTFGDQGFGERADEALGHREQRMRIVRTAGAAVAFIDDAAAMQDDDAIGVVGGERLFPGHRGAGVEGREGDDVDVVGTREWAFGARQHDRRRAPADRRGGDEFAPVRKAPAGHREEPHGRIVVAHLLVQRWRRALHPAELDGVAVSGGERWRLRRRLGGCSGGEEHDTGQQAFYNGHMVSPFVARV